MNVFLSEYDVKRWKKESRPLRFHTSKFSYIVFILQGRIRVRKKINIRRMRSKTGGPWPTNSVGWSVVQIGHCYRSQPMNAWMGGAASQCFSLCVSPPFLLSKINFF